MSDWDTELTPEERDSALDKIAYAVVRRGMQTPAILFLEMHRPLSFIASQGLVMSSAFTAPVVGLDNVQIASKLMADRENVERLIQRIEDLSQSKRGATNDKNRPQADPGGACAT